MPVNELLVPVSGFKGLNNKQDRTKLGLDWLEVADNVLIGSMNDVTTRAGCTSVLTNINAIHSSRDGLRGYVVDTNNALSLFDGVSTQQLVSDIGSGPYLWSDAESMTFVLGADRGYVLYPDRVEPWGIEPPQKPTLTPVPGSLIAGTYQVVATYYNEHGRDSGAVAAQSIVLSDAKSAIQAEIDSVPAENMVRWWMTPPDGSVLFYVGESAEKNIVLNGPISSLAIPLKTQFFDKPPAPALQIAFWMGRVWVAYHDPARGFTRIYPSQPIDYHYFAYDDQDCIDVEGRVTLMAGTQAGLLVGTHRAIHAFDQNLNKQTLSEYGAVDSQARFDDDGNCWFWTTRGVCVYPNFQNITEDVYSISPGRKAALVVRESGGERHVIVSPSTGDEGAYNAITQTITV